MMRLVISIIGRPNTGKSTLFNRLVGKKLALVDDKAGVTRDRRKGAAKLYDLEFDIIDTAGYSSSPDDRLTKGMCAQTEAAICEADVIFFVVDAQKGILPEDKTLADILRSSGKSILILANKAEARSAQAGFLESWELGCGQPIAISSEHGLGMSDIRDALAIKLEKQNTQLSCFLNENLEEKKEPKDKPLKMAIAGQPNAGKSTLINTLLGEDRLLVGPEAGITRDTISVEWSWKNKKVRLFDTAGIRKKAKVKEKLEKLAVADALRAIQFAEVVVILLDATIPFEKQDLQIVDLIIREGRALVIAFSKWDLIDNKKETLQELYEKTRNLLPQIAGVRLVPISSEKQYGLEKLMEAVFFANTIWNKRLSTGPLNRWLNKAVLHNPPPAVAGRRSKIKYITQVKARPPSFVLSCNRPDKIPTSYVRHLMNGLRSVFEIPGVPIRIVLRSSENPFAKKDKKRNAD